MPKGTFKRFWNYVKKTIRENKVATVIGILIGGVGTRFLEDGNLLVTSVFTGIVATFTVGASVGIKKLN
jgi:methylthioribose-1-phosphate isomerase